MSQEQHFTFRCMKYHGNEKCTGTHKHMMQLCWALKHRTHNCDNRPDMIQKQHTSFSFIDHRMNIRNPSPSMAREIESVRIKGTPNPAATSATFINLLN